MINKGKIIHIFPDSPIIPRFIDFIIENFPIAEHYFFCGGNKYKDSRISSNSIELIIKSNLSEKIILHGFFGNKALLFFLLQPWLLKKIYWVIWGGDIYCHLYKDKSWKYQLSDFLRAIVIRDIGHIVTYIKGDYLLAQQWYGVSGQYHECIMYPSNVYNHYDLQKDEDATISIIMGNSADISNNHRDIFEKIKKYKKYNIKIYCPLSYGDQKYAKQISQEGEEIFGNKFIPLMDFMPFKSYLKLLSKIDIAIFAHKRQQAMGNTITLLGLGKKVYMRSSVTQWDTLGSAGIMLFDYNEFMVACLQESDKVKNQELIKKHFSERVLKKQWGEIFYK